MPAILNDDSREVSIEHDELVSSPNIPPTPSRPRYTAHPSVNTLLDVMYDSDSSPSRSQPQIGGGQRRASSIPRGDYATPTRRRTTPLFPTTLHAGEFTQDAVTHRLQLIAPSNQLPAAQQKPLPVPPGPHPLGPRALSNLPRSRSVSSQPVSIQVGPAGNAYDAACNSEQRALPAALFGSGTGPMVDCDDEPQALDLDPMSNDPASLFEDDSFLGLDGFQPEHAPSQGAQVSTTTLIPVTPGNPTSLPSPQPETANPTDSEPDIVSDDLSPQKGGRISKANHKILEEAFEFIDETYARLAEETGFTEDRVVNLWNKHSGRGTRGYNPWNIYESYLANNLVEELERANYEVPSTIRWDQVTHAQRQICYENFQKHYSDGVWEDILHVYDLSRKCEPTGTTFSKRSALFHKIYSQLVRLVSSFHPEVSGQANTQSRWIHGKRNMVSNLYLGCAAMFRTKMPHWLCPMKRSTLKK
jgi:hypothetical protein